MPVSNFLAWYVTVYTIYQLFALYIIRRSPANACALVTIFAMGAFNLLAWARLAQRPQSSSL